MKIIKNIKEFSDVLYYKCTWEKDEWIFYKLHHIVDEYIYGIRLNKSRKFGTSSYKIGKIGWTDFSSGKKEYTKFDSPEEFNDYLMVEEL